MRCTLRKAALIVVVCCNIHNFIIDERISREGDKIDLGTGRPAVSDPLNGVSVSPEVFSQEFLHWEREIRRHVRPDDGSARRRLQTS
jgi:hypothetical protein